MAHFEVFYCSRCREVLREVYGTYYTYVTERLNEYGDYERVGYNEEELNDTTCPACGATVQSAAIELSAQDFFAMLGVLEGGGITYKPGETVEEAINRVLHGSRNNEEIYA